MTVGMLHAHFDIITLHFQMLTTSQDHGMMPLDSLK